MEGPYRSGRLRRAGSSLVGALGILCFLFSSAQAADSSPDTQRRKHAAPLSLPAPSPSDPASAPQRPPPRAPAPWPQAAALVPGLLIHGAGPWLQGRSQTAARLLWWELSSLGLTLGAGAGLALTGAARDLVGPLALAGISGVTLFGASFLTGVYAVTGPPEGFGQAQTPPLLVSSIGYNYVSDPHFTAAHYVHTELDALVGPVHLGLTTSVAPAQGVNHVGAGQQQVLAGLRMFGQNGVLLTSTGDQVSSESTIDETHLELLGAWRRERFASSGFSNHSYEFALQSRFNLRHYLPDVRGAFLQLLAGYARQTTQYELPSVRTEDTRSVLLAHLGFGVYLGRPAPASLYGEAQLYYDHRHDGLVGGLKVPGIGSGAAGHLGLTAQAYLASPLGVRFTGEFGAAASIALSVLYRIDAPTARKEFPNAE